MCQDDEVVSPGDLKLADEIARFVAERAFEFDDVEARAWALTDFSVWARLAGQSPRLAFESDLDRKSEPENGDPELPT